MARKLPPDFLVGAGTSAFQIEGGADADGRTPSIWDVFPAANGDTGLRACEHYYRYKDDVAVMKHIGLQAYRFSLSWSRIHPDSSRRVNAAGLDFYDRLVDELLEQGIEPWITLHHWDLPLWLHQQGGWRERAAIQAFSDYTRDCVRALGDRVKSWITINEPWSIAMLGYKYGRHAPGLQLEHDEVLTVMHHLLVAHGASVRVLRDHDAGLNIGIALNPKLPLPVSAAPEDLQAAETAWSKEVCWWFDPLYKGHYPHEVAERWVEDMPCCHTGDMDLISSPLDFLGLNLYFPVFVRHDPERAPFFYTEATNELVLPSTEMGWQIYSPFLHYGIERIHRRYQPGPIYITENGCAVEDRLDHRGRVHDLWRKEYLRSHMGQLLDLLEEGVPIGGYFAWSLLDNFEWEHGYAKKFGIVHVDFETQERSMKTSAEWYQRVAKDRKLHHHYHDILE